VQEDPGQTINVIDQHPDVVAQMRAAYEQWWQETRPLMINETVPMSPVRPFHQLYRKQLEGVGIPDWSASARVKRTEH
jgi:arylsulfatase